MSVKKHEGGMLINPIRDGTVIDHIAAGEALTVLKILGTQRRHAVEADSRRQCL